MFYSISLVTPQTGSRQHSANATISKGFYRGVYHGEESHGHCCWWPLSQILRGIVFLRGKPIVSWFDLETCSKVTEDGAMIGQNTYDFLLVFYSNFAVSVTVSALQSILCWNDLAGRLWPLTDSVSGALPKWRHLLRRGQKLSQIFHVNTCIIFCLRLHTDRQTDRMTDKSTWSHNFRLGEGNYNYGRRYMYWMTAVIIILYNGATVDEWDQQMTKNSTV